MKENNHGSSSLSRPITESSSVNTAGSFLPTIIKTENEILFGELPIVWKFLKGVLNLRPAVPRYFTTWNVSVVLKYRKSLQALNQSDLKRLSYRLAILLCITTGQWDQTLFYASINLILFKAGKLINFIPKLLKQPRPAHHLEPIVFLRYPCQEICVISHVEEYIEKTKDLWKDQNFLLSFVKSYKCITISAIFRWCVTVLKNADLVIAVFGSHST